MAFGKFKKTGFFVGTVISASVTTHQVIDQISDVSQHTALMVTCIQNKSANITSGKNIISDTKLPTASFGSFMQKNRENSTYYTTNQFNFSSDLQPQSKQRLSGLLFWIRLKVITNIGRCVYA